MAERNRYTRSRPLERTITRKCMAVLETVPNSFVSKIHGGRMQKTGLLDIFFTCAELNGKTVWIEIKREGEDMTRIQEHTAREIEKADGVVLLVRSLASLTRWMNINGVTYTPPPRDRSGDLGRER